MADISYNNCCYCPCIGLPKERTKVVKIVAAGRQQRSSDAGGGEGREMNKQDGERGDKGQNLTANNRKGGRGEEHGSNQADENSEGLEGEGQRMGQKDEGQDKGQGVEKRDGIQESEGKKMKNTVDVKSI
jgi:hypothetical protein